MPTPRNDFSVDRAQARSCRVLIVDLQTRLLPHILAAKHVVESCGFLIQAARVFGVPIEVTEQYPQGLGSTTPELDVSGLLIHEKLRFSGFECTGWGYAGEATDGRTQVVLAGIETPICVLQTALDLLAAGYQVFVAVDAVGCRRAVDGEIALRRLESSGAIITTVESVAYEWCDVAGTAEFKQLSQMAKQRSHPV